MIIFSFCLEAFRYQKVKLLMEIILSVQLMMELFSPT
jgi:hypothetical protein